MLPGPIPGEVLSVGVTGHRRLGTDPRSAWRVWAECAALLDRLREIARGQGKPLVAWSALAVGADTLFARAAVGLGIPLRGVIPFHDYPDDFQGDERRQFDEILGMCEHVDRLPARKKSDQAYLKAGLWVVDHSDVVIAVWDGRPAAGTGGTGDVADYAVRKGKLLLRVDPHRAG